MVLKNAVEDEVCGEYQHDTSYHRHQGQLREHIHFPECEISGHREQESEHYQQYVKRLHACDERNVSSLLNHSSLFGHSGFICNDCLFSNHLCNHCFVSSLCLDNLIQYHRHECHERDKRNANDRPPFDSSRVQAYAQRTDSSHDKDSHERRSRKRQDKKQNGHSGNEYKPSGQAFPIQHEYESYIYQCRSGLTLEHDYGHRNEDHQSCDYEVPEAADLVSQAAHHGSQHQRRRYLRYLRRLKPERSEVEP